MFLLLDSSVAFSLAKKEKARSSSPALLLLLRKISAPLLAGWLSLLPGWPLRGELTWAKRNSRMSESVRRCHTFLCASMSFALASEGVFEAARQFLLSAELIG